VTIVALALGWWVDHKRLAARMWAENRLLEYDRYRALEAHLEAQKKLFTARRQLEAAEASDEPSHSK
jgi:hypothetical protein